MFSYRSLPREIQQYILVTINYWMFTLTDGALRMLVVLYFYDLGYTPFEIAMLFIFYEIFGVITNLIGGWLGAKMGLNKTMNVGLLLQIIALAMLLLPQTWLSIAWVMASQALSGIAKDLNKMSAKSAIKTLVPADAKGQLYRWVAALTGSKNALKGVGFFLGGALLSLVGFTGAILIMCIGLIIVWLFSLWRLDNDMGRAKSAPKFSQIFSKSRAINYLSAARLFLFAARDVWFVVALPVYLSVQFGWTHWTVGSFMALWVIGYGFVQALAPRLTKQNKSHLSGQTERQQAILWAALLSLLPAAMAISLYLDWLVHWTLLGGLMVFGFLFAINSSLHSYLVVSYAKEDGVSLDVGFYYMANAMGRLVGTVLSGWLYQAHGLATCLVVSAIFIALSALISMGLPQQQDSLSETVQR